MAGYVCTTPGCPNRVPKQGYCPSCEAERRSKTPKQRKRYGAPHRRSRAAWAPLVAAGDVSCARCGQLIGKDEPWDLGHADGTSTGGPEHRGRCNRSAGARFGNAKRTRNV